MTMTMRETIRLFREVMRCQQCGKSLLVSNTAGYRQKYQPEAVTPETHCFCLTSPIHDYLAGSRSHMGPKPQPDIEARKVDIRSRAAGGESLYSIAKSLGVTHQSVSQVVHASRFRSRQQVRRAVHAGRLTRPDNCQRCGETANCQAHHTDYSKPLDVEWLCRGCHTAAHHGDLTERNDWVRGLASDGLTSDAIAQQVGISRSRVRQIIGGLLPAENPYLRPGHKTHCPKGHELTVENTIEAADGRRCLICRTAYRQAYNERRRVSTCPGAPADPANDRRQVESELSR